MGVIMCVCVCVEGWGWVYVCRPGERGRGCSVCV